MTGLTGFRRLDERLFPDLNSGCWLWEGAIGTHGYGAIGFNRKIVTTHRLAWMLKNGPVPDGLFILHKCDNKPCCNPHHLYAGTVTDNVADMLRRRGPTGFKRGHKMHYDPRHRRKWLSSLPRGKGHHRSAARLTEDVVLQIFNAEGSQTEIASRFGVCQQQVSKIKRKKIRSYLYANT